MTESLTLGLDIGGTSTRAAVISSAGKQLGSGRAGGGNPTTHGAAALAQVADAIDQALAGVEPAEITAATVGMAGYGRLVADADLARAFADMWRHRGLACQYRLVSDVLVAYAAGTPEPDGTVVVAGTGAIAARVRHHDLEHVADGHGWLLGDLGSGYWLGRQAVRAVLTDLDREHPPGPLAVAVLREIVGDDTIAARWRDTAQAVVQSVRSQPPIALARLAPLVLAHYGADDPVAVNLVQQAAAHLADTVAAARAATEQTPLVQGGGLLTSDTPLSTELAALLKVSWPRLQIHRAADAATAAAWLSIITAPHDAAPLSPAALHATLFEGS